MNVSSFFAGLKRRNVYKVAIAYVVVGWLLIQIATQIFPFFEIPNWSIRPIVLLVALGFPVAVIIAWALDLAPGSLKRGELADDLPDKPLRSRVWIHFTIVAAAISLGLFLVGRYVGPRQTGTFRSPTKSIAVLPFENLSADPDNAYFADGIQEEILTRLASIADLKVISRTSTSRYQSKPANLSEIAKQLGVANILEGTVQKAADQVRVNVQLINAHTDSHLWAETYNRKVTDIFGVESEVAKRIAESLQAKLTGREEQGLAVRPTNDPEAYNAYLLGLTFEAGSTYSNDALRKAIESYERAVELDPTFALGWARLSRAHASLYFVRADQTAARRDAAKRALDNAQKLQPTSPEIQLTLGYYEYWVLRDYELARATFELVRKLLPRNSEALRALGGVARRQASWDESVAYWNEALALDPRNVELLSDTAWTHAMLRHFPAALKLYDQALDIIPSDPNLIAVKASIYQAEGKFQEAAKLLSEINTEAAPENAFIIKMTQLRLERNHGEAIRLLQGRLAQFQSVPQIDKGTYQVLLAFTQLLAGDATGARLTAQQARNTLGPLYSQQPDNSFFAQQVALAEAALGDKDAALKEVEHAITLLPRSIDPVSGPTREEALALIQTMFGDTGRPISTLTRLLEVPYISWLYGPMPATAALLRVDPVWDRLRVEPAFQKLCEEKKP